MTTTLNDLTVEQWAALWGDSDGYAVMLHEGVEIVGRVPCRVVVVSSSPREIVMTLDRVVEFTFREPVIGVTFYAESDGLVLRKEVPGLVLMLGDTVVVDPHGLDSVSRLA